MKLSYLKHILETKGLWHGIERLGQIMVRFSRGRSRFKHLLSSLERDPSFHNFKVTFCVTASLLKRHKDLIDRLSELGHEIAAHGLSHVRMGLFDHNRQSRILQDCFFTFRNLGFSITGFRCPYLNFNKDTISALIRSPYQWTSQHLIIGSNGELPVSKLRRVKQLYQTTQLSETVSLPRFAGRILEIPISAPDDEMIWERYRMRSEKLITPIWLDVLSKTLESGELFHLLFHPERFDFVRPSLLRVIEEVRKPEVRVWTPTLGELSVWWRTRSKARWHLEETSSDGLTAWINAPEKSVILGKSQDMDPRDRIFQDYVPANPHSESQKGLGYFAGRTNRYSIGISDNCAPLVKSFLAEEGYIVEHSDRPERHSFFVSNRRDFNETDKRALLREIELCEKPLLRLWRWPKRAQCAFVISSDVDAIDLRDFLHRARQF